MWKPAAMVDAIRHAQGRVIDTDAARPTGTDYDWDVVMFTDGTGIAVKSEWSGPYSEVTPDTDCQDPSWRIFHAYTAAQPPQ